jgi:hypothetical protein
MRQALRSGALRGVSEEEVDELASESERFEETLINIGERWFDHHPGEAPTLADIEKAFYEHTGVRIRPGIFDQKLRSIWCWPRNSEQFAEAVWRRRAVREAAAAGISRWQIEEIPPMPGGADSQAAKQERRDVALPDPTRVDADQAAWDDFWDQARQRPSVDLRMRRWRDSASFLRWIEDTVMARGEHLDGDPSLRNGWRTREPSRTTAWVEPCDARGFRRTFCAPSLVRPC